MVTERNDALGQPLKVGDAVVFVTGKYNMFHHGTIEAFTPKRIRIVTPHWHTTIDESQVIKKPGGVDG